MGRVVRILVLSFVLACGPAALALANGTAVQATDPSANTPAGVVYSIPLDSARQDAAPHGHHGGSGSAGGGVGGGSGGAGSGGSASGGSSSGGSASGSGSGSSSAASGGSSSTGSAAGSGSGGSSSGSSASGGSSTGGGASGSGGAPILVSGGQPGSLIHSGNGFGSSSQVPGLNTPASAGLAAVHSTPSSAPLLAIMLSIVVLTLGGYIGIAAWRPRRRQLAAAANRPQLPPGA